MSIDTGIPDSGGRPEQAQKRSVVTLLLGVGLVVIGSLWAFDHFRLRAENRALTKQLHQRLDQEIRSLERDYQRIMDELKEVEITSTVTVDGKEIPYEELPEERRRQIESELEDYFKNRKPESDK